MPHRILETEDLAKYLNLPLEEIEQLVKDREIPFERHGQRLRFRKVEIDAWASPRVLGMEGRHLANYHSKTATGAPPLAREDQELSPLITEDRIDVALTARTKASVLRQMAALAASTGLVNDEPALVKQLEARESAFSTGLPGGLAVPHPGQPDSWLLEGSLVVLGRTIQRIPFGAPDGKATDLFFLVCCPEPAVHLHALARICLMAQKTELLQELRAATTNSEMLQALVNAEEQVA